MINHQWSIEDSKSLYGIQNWGAHYFDIDNKGQVVVNIPALSSADNSRQVAILDVVNEMADRGLDMPAILRIDNLLDERIRILNETFLKAIKLNSYQNHYRGVFPIKVNQQAHVIDEIEDFGRRYHHGFEVGSKAELLIALTRKASDESLIICNGYKDTEFVALGLHARRMGINCFFVLETPAELPIIIRQSEAMGVKPLLGVRIKSAVNVDGHWSKDSGDGSIFGLSSGNLIRVIEQLEQHSMLDCLQLLHCHIGSQIPNIRNIRAGVAEAARYYQELVDMGAAMGYIDLGGGLGVDYEGSRTNNTHSMNYQLEEYCVNVVETLCETLNHKNTPHPVIITESGRATVAYSSLLLFNILDVRDHKPTLISNLSLDELENSHHELINNLWRSLKSVNEKNFQECYNDAIFYRDEIRSLFLRGQVTLKERALADNIALALFERVAQFVEHSDRVPQELEKLPELLADIYYGNFSLFQSLPDMWAIDQLLPVMPIHRLDEEPKRQAVIADITCDSDGKISQFTIDDEVKSTLKLHEFSECSPYYLGVFLIGAYQETLGDLHNLFGDTNVVSVHINTDNSFDFVKEFHGDSIADVLSYVEYEPKQLLELFRKNAEQAVKKGRITPKQRREMTTAFTESLQGYTYLEE